MGRKHRKKYQASSQKATVEATGTGISSRYRFFLWTSGFFALATLFLRLDVITIWPGAEGWSLDAALSGKSSVVYFPTIIQGWISDLTEPFYLAPRMLSAVFMLATAMLFYHWGRKLFSRRTTRLSLLLAAAGLWLPFFGKVATADSWALFGQLGFVLSMLMLMRSRHAKYAYWTIAFGVVASLAAPLSTLLLSVFLFFYFGLIRKDALVRSPLIVINAAGFFVIAVLGLPVDRTYYFWGSLSLDAYTTFVGYFLFGVLPQVGWFLAAVRDAVFRHKKKDELMRSIWPFLLVGFLAQSLVVFLMLSILMAKQLENYFREPYPWRSWVRTGAILHLVFAFFAALLGLFAGLAAFSGDGYRATLGAATAYWIFSLLAVIGLYGMKRDFAIGGTILSGLLATLFFWTQVYPYIETQRGWPQQAIEQFDLPSQGSLTLQGDRASTAMALPYLRVRGLDSLPQIPLDQAAGTGEEVLVVRPIGYADTILRADQLYGRTFVRGIVVEQ